MIPTVKGRDYFLHFFGGLAFGYYIYCYTTKTFSRMKT